MTTGQEIAVIPPGAALTVFGTNDPAEIVAVVEAKAKALGQFIHAHGMSRRLESAAAVRRREERGGQAPREYVFIEGWSFLGQMLGIAPVTREISEVRDRDDKLVGFEARVELVRADGAVVGGAIGECSWAEERWAEREPYAIKSMAQTRAVGKAFRLSYGFVMAAAGFEATPAEEMPDDDATRSRQQRGRAPVPPQARPAPPAPQGSGGRAEAMPDLPNPGAVAREAYGRYGMQPSEVDRLLGSPLREWRGREREAWAIVAASRDEAVPVDVAGPGLSEIADACDDYGIAPEEVLTYHDETVADGEPLASIYARIAALAEAARADIEGYVAEAVALREVAEATAAAAPKAEPDPEPAA